MFIQTINIVDATNNPIHNLNEKLLANKETLSNKAQKINVIAKKNESSVITPHIISLYLISPECVSSS